MKSKQILQAIGVSLVAVALSAGTTYASISFGGGNGTTGPNSENSNEVSFDSDVHVDVSNDADADNDYEICVTTGDNEFERNTAIDDIWTGDILGDFDIENVLNSGDIDLGYLGGYSGLSHIDLENDLTGPESVNENEVNIDSDVDIDIRNDADIDNNINLSANSGNNSIRRNTVVGDVVSGDVHVGGVIRNEANAGMGSIDLSDLGRADVNADFENYLTGPNSENENSLDVDNKTRVSVRNDADIDNSINLEGNSGNNEIGNNTCVGDVHTGDVRLDFSVRNIAN